MDETPRNLKAMISEAKDTSEIMIDLADAALFFSGVDIAGIVTRGPRAVRPRTCGRRARGDEERLGYRVVEDDDTGQVDLMPAAGRH
jgi:hypothetical protein